MSITNKLLNSDERVDTLMTQKHKVSKKDLAFMSSLSEAIMQKSSSSSRVIVWIIMLLVSVFLVWAYFTELDEVTRGSGKIIPSAHIQKIQYLEGGILSKMLVHEGETVVKGQALLKIEDLTFSTKFAENRIKLAELEATKSRLEAQSFHTKLHFSKALLQDFHGIVTAQKNLFLGELKQQKSKKSILQSQLVQEEQLLKEAKAKRLQIENSYNLLSEEITLTIPMVKRNLIADVDLLKLKREASALNGEYDAVLLSLPRLESKIKESKSALTELDLDFENHAKKELGSVLTEIATIAESQKLLSEKIHQSILRSPVEGTVKQVFINTQRGVIHPGSDILEIVPTSSYFLAEVKIKPADIAYLYPQQKGVIKFTAYDFGIHGGLQGEVVHISADTIVDEVGESYYMVRLKSEKNYLGDADKPLNIIVGMTVDVDILAGKKSVLDYLLKPIIKAKDSALREK
jgi:membrane fusion protein, adhesin transport system